MACKRYDGQSILFSARSDCSWVFKAEHYTEDWETRYMQTRYSYSGVHKNEFRVQLGSYGRYTEDWETRYMQTRYSYDGVHKKEMGSLEINILGTTSCQGLIKHLHCNQTAMMSTCICYAS